MGERVKNIITLLVVFWASFGVIRLYDFVTKKPDPIDRSPNPEIIRLTQRQDSMVRSANQDHKNAEASRQWVNLILDSIKNDRKKVIYDRKKLKNTPDSMLQHRADSILRANGIH